MDAAEEGNLVVPNVSVHAGIFVFSYHVIPIDKTIVTCMTVITEEKTICNGILDITKKSTIKSVIVPYKHTTDHNHYI